MFITLCFKSDLMFLYIVTLWLLGSSWYECYLRSWTPIVLRSQLRSIDVIVNRSTSFTSHRGSILAQPESLNVILVDRFLLNFELVMSSFRSSQHPFRQQNSNFERLAPVRVKLYESLLRKIGDGKESIVQYRKTLFHFGFAVFSSCMFECRSTCSHLLDPVLFLLCAAFQNPSQSLLSSRKINMLHRELNLHLSKFRIDSSSQFIEPPSSVISIQQDGTIDCNFL